MISRRRALSRELRITVGRRLRELRISHHESQEAVAWAADVTQGSISNYENGRNEVPLSVLMSICEYFRIPLSEVFPEAAGFSAAVSTRYAERPPTFEEYAEYPAEVAS